MEAVFQRNTISRRSNGRLPYQCSGRVASTAPSGVLAIDLSNGISKGQTTMQAPPYEGGTNEPL